MRTWVTRNLFLASNPVMTARSLTTEVITPAQLDYVKLESNGEQLVVTIDVSYGVSTEE
jgi:hypothetical protein